MAGPVQRAISGAVGSAAAIATVGKKLNEDAEQVKLQTSKEAEAKAKADEAISKEAKAVALEADLVKMGADPESAHSFMDAQALGLDTKSYGMIKNKQGKFVGSYSSLARKLSQDSLMDSFSSKVINQKGFAERVVALGGPRRGRVDALVKASEGGKK